MLQKTKSDGSIKFENNTSYDEFITRSKKIEQEFRIFFWNSQILLRPFQPKINSLCRDYLNAGSERNPNIMQKNDMNEFVEFVLEKFLRVPYPSTEPEAVEAAALHRECLKEMIRISVINMHAEDRGVKRTVDLFYDIEVEKKKYNTDYKSDSSIKFNGDSSNLDQTENNSRIFSPILPYPVGGVVATADVIFKCSKKNDDKKHLFRWQFDGCISN